MADGGDLKRVKRTKLSEAIRGAKGGASSSRTPVEAPDTLNSNAHAHILDLLGEGELAGFYSNNPLKDIFLDETPVMNEDGTLNFTDVYVDWRLGTQDQTYMKGFPSVANETVVGTELKAITPWTRAISNIQLSAIRVRLSVAALSKTNSTNGDINGHSVSYAIDLATDGGAFITVLTNAMTGKTNTKYERSHRIDLPQASSGWTIRVRRLTADTDSAGIQDTTAVESFTEIMDVKMRYPNSAYCGIKMNSSQFRSIPARGFRMLGRLMRVPSNYDPVAGTYTGLWDGTFQLAWTRNPAWIFYDLVTNERFGLGQFVDESQIDKWSLYKIGQYCDEQVPDGKGGTEPRFTATVYLQRQEEAYKVLQDLASVFRGISYWGSGAVIPVGDMPRDPVYTYTNANVKDGKFSYQGSARRARHTVALVSWSDPEDFNRQKVEYVEDEEAIARYGIQTTQITAVGCTSQGQAQRVGRWLLLTERYETNTVTFAVGLDQMLALPGNVIRVADVKRAGRRIGGRIKSMTAGRLTATVDALPTPTPVAGDELVCIMPNGSAEKRTIASVNVGAKTVTVTAAFSAQAIPESIWAIESATLKTQLYTVISVGEGEGLTAVITGLQHEPGKFDAVDNGTHIEPRVTTSIASPVQRPPTNLTVSAKPRAGYVQASTVVTAHWTAAAGAVSYEVEWRRSNGEWSSPQKVLGTEAELFNAFAGDYVCKVAARNALGILSVPAVSETFVVADQSLTPGFVDDINADIADALLTAENAQATADGSIEFFWQTDAPVIGSLAGQAKVGDFWVDTNDGNHLWRATGGVWVDAQDDQIGQALIAAQTAQGTADGKVKTWFGAAAPGSPDVTATKGIGDLWFNTTTKKLFRWNGTNWDSEIADVTLDQIGGSGVNIVPEEYTRRINTDLPAMHRSGATPASVIDTTPSGFAFRFETTGVSTVGDWAYFAANSTSDRNITVQPGKYLFSYYARSPSAGHLIQPRFNPNVGGVVAGTQRALTTSYVRYTDVIEFTDPLVVSANFFFYLNQSGVSGRHIFIDRLMLEPMVGRLQQASSWAPGPAGRISYDAIAAAALAQDTADGKIQLFQQPGIPSNGSPDFATLGDLWIDTDDDSFWRHNGTTFVESQDNAIAQAIAAAAGAQGTADGKVTTFYKATAPVNADAPPAIGVLKVGDLWYNTTDKSLHRYSGSGWVYIADITADKIAASGTNLMWEEYSFLTKAQVLTSVTTPSMYSSGPTKEVVADANAINGFRYKFVSQSTSTAEYAGFASSASDYPIFLQGGKKYLFSFYGYAATSNSISIWIRGNVNVDSDNFVVSAAGRARYQVVFDLTSAADGYYRFGVWNNRGGVSGRSVYMDGLMVEPMIGNKEEPSPFVPGPSARQTAIAIANAAFAQATADGKVEMFRQASAPTATGEGDIWIDTDDGKMYTWTGAAWVYDPNDELGNAIDTAQATANARNTTFYQITAPTANAAGDLWYNKNTMELKRWSGSAWVSTNGAPSGGSGENMLSNPNFVANDSAAVNNAVAEVGDTLSDGWYCYQTSARADTDIRWMSDGSIRLRCYGTVAVANGTVIVLAARTLGQIPVEEGRTYKFSMEQTASFNGTIPANVNIRSRITLRTYDAANAQVSYAEVCTGSRAAGTFTGTYTVPAGSGVKYVTAQVEGLIQNVSGASWTHNSSVAFDVRVAKVSMTKVASLDTEVQDGTDYGRFSVLDGYTFGGFRRFGLRIPGSGHRIGDQRNLPQSLVNAYGSVRTTGALSATSAGAISVLAHTIRMGGSSVAYSAVSNAVTGLTQNTTYTVYCIDDAYAGGVRTWFASTAKIDAIMNLGDGIVIAGAITIPTSGSSSGGGGGYDPGDCVDWDTLLPDGRLVRDLIVGDEVLCVDITKEGSLPELHRVRGIRFGEEECYRLTTDNLISIVQSESTPMDLRGGGIARTPEMFGKEVLTLSEGVLEWRNISDVQKIGRRRVVKVDLGNRMFFAGEHSYAAIATHNVIYKP